MEKEFTYNWASLRHDLSEVLSDYSEYEPLLFLQAIKGWAERHTDIFKDTFEEDAILEYPALFLLLNGHSADFVFQHSRDAIRQIKEVLQKPIFIQTHCLFLVGIEWIISKLVVVTSEEECPICEGELGYWVNTDGEPRLQCSSCGSGFLLNGDRCIIGPPTVPALREDLRSIAEKEKRLKGRQPIWVKLL